jgi:hypothetical protein
MTVSAEVRIDNGSTLQGLEPSAQTREKPPCPASAIQRLNEMEEEQTIQAGWFMRQF